VIARVVAAATLVFTTAAAARAEEPSPPGAGGGAATGAAAAPPDAHASRRPELVEVTVVGGAPDYESLRLRIGAHVAMGVPLLWNRLDRFNPLAELLRGAPATRTSTLRCWVDLTDARRATLYFAGEGGERFFVRELAMSGRLDEIDQQSLAQVLELSITALLENQEIGFTRDEAREMFSRAQPRPPELAVAPTAPPRRWSLTPAAGYAVERTGASLPMAQGPGLAIALSAGREAGLRLGVWIAGQYQLPAAAHGPEIGVRLQTAAARAGVEAGWWRWRARLGGGVDWTQVTPLPGDAIGAATTLTVASSHWSTSWVASGALALRLPLEKALGSGRRALSLVLVVELVPSSTQYQLQDGSGVRVVFARERTRPGLGLELAF
jgi:hypothetical protein